MTISFDQTASSALPTFFFSGAVVDITPTMPVPLAGSVGRSAPFNRIASRLEANAIFLSSGLDSVLFISADLLYFGAAASEVITQRAARYNLNRSQVILSASHTHFAPASDSDKPLLGKTDSGYLTFLQEQLADLVDRVMTATRYPVAMYVGRKETNLNVNRRRRWRLPTLTREGLNLRPTIIMAPVWDGIRDGNIDTVRLVDPSGGIVAVLWKYACHPVCFSDNLSISSEYPGHARTLARKTIGADVPIVFWQGFTGDVRPRLVGRQSVKERLQSLRRGPSFGQVSGLDWVNWAENVANAMVGSLFDPNGHAVIGQLSIASENLPLSTILDVNRNPQLSGKCIHFQRVAVGDKIELLFIAAEVCSPYLSMLILESHTICIGYTGDVFGYLPSEKQAIAGGYEANGFFRWFGLAGAFRPGFEHHVLEAVKRLRNRPTNC